MTTVVAVGMDWIPRDVLQAITNKAVSIKDKVTVLEDSELLTAIVLQSRIRESRTLWCLVQTGSANVKTVRTILRCRVVLMLLRRA